jgi:ornithine lipid N-methyltransferase
MHKRRDGHSLSEHAARAHEPARPAKHLEHQDNMNAEINHDTSLQTSMAGEPASKRSRKADGEFRSGLLFLRKFFKHGRRIGSVWPSSRSLSRATLKEVDWERAQVIVELGAGTGPITAEIVHRLKPHTTFLAIERDEDFARILRKRFAGRANVEIVHGDVREIDSILKARKITNVDYFISGLATPTLPRGVQKRMFAAVRKYLAPHGVFSNITEVPLWYLRYYRGLFDTVDFQFVPINIPPGGVYHCRRMRRSREDASAVVK